MRFYKKKILRHLGGIKKKYLSAFIKPAYIGDKYQCPACLANLAYFNSFPDYYHQQLRQNRFIHSLRDFETLNLKNGTCPACRTGDSNRLYAIYLRDKLSKLDTNKKYTFIDFAPVSSIAQIIESYRCVNYRSADLFMPNVDDNVDIMDMKIYKNNSVDMFLCAHILEHVTDDVKAMRELYRILKPGGWGIIMVPILLSINKISEDPNITSEHERWKYYGQGDHVRMYSKKGFIQRLVSVGFKVHQFNINYFGKSVFKKYGISQKSVLYVASK
jgi:SAM-dependent methyltransferase